LDSEGIYWAKGYIPYDWLFKRSTAVIHHGGAGTTGKALRAGIPNIILPFTSDQPFWGRRVYKLGAGHLTNLLQSIYQRRSILQSMIKK